MRSEILVRTSLLHRRLMFEKHYRVKMLLDLGCYKFQRKATFRNTFNSIIKIEGCITCDGVKIEVTDKEYYDFVTNYLEIHRHQSATIKKCSWKINTRLFFITPHSGAESTENIRSNIDKNISSITNKSQVDIENHFPFAPDCAATMPKVFGTYV